MKMDKPFRTFLVVVDEGTEIPTSLYYAARHASIVGGRVAILYVIEPLEIQPWAGVEATLNEDAIARASAEMAANERVVESIIGTKPLLFIRQGNQRSVLLQFMEQQPDISVLVLAAHTGEAGPGPLISYLTSAKGIHALKIPLIIVPDTYKLAGDNLVV